MPETAPLLDGHVAFDPSGDLDGFLSKVPARWVVYLLCDGDDRPVQLLCVKNLRASLKRRLGGGEEVGPSRRVNYRELVRHIHFRRVDSAFEADWIYFETARQLFPLSYQGMVGFRPAWFVHVNPEAEFPRYVKSTDLTKPGLYIGPVEDKHVAARLIELVEDLFDLCRYYNLLTEAPNARACAYKEMGKCPAPCDGSISMEQYRHLIEWSARTLVDPADVVRTHSRRMHQAAAELHFELAAKIKAYVSQLSQLATGPYRHARWLRDFQFVSFQHGPRAGTVKLFLITPGTIVELACMIDEPRWPGELLGLILAFVEAQSRQYAEATGGSFPSPGSPGEGRVGVETNDSRATAPVPTLHRSAEEGGKRSPAESQAGVERIGIVSHHLFSPKTAPGAFLRVEELDEKKIAKAYRELRKRPAEEPGEGEGVVKELQAL